jgi:putative transposase
MRNRLYVHLVWTTRDRLPLIDAARAASLAENLPVIARQERAGILGLGIVSTHLHMLLHLNPGTNIPRMVQRMKGGTAALLNAHSRSRASKLQWAKGYSVASVSERALPLVYAYVCTQAAHHPTEAIRGWAPPAPDRLTCDDLVALATSAEPRL